MKQDSQRGWRWSNRCGVCLKLHPPAPDVAEPAAATGSRIRKLAAATEPTDQAELEIASKQRELESVEAEIANVSRNMALAELPGQFKAVASVFEQLDNKKSRLQTEVEAAQSHEPVTHDIEAKVSQAMAFAEQLTEWASRQGSLETAKQVFDLTNARRHLQFKRVQVKQRLLNKVSGGVVTFGDAEPPISIYEGPTSRSRIKSEKKPALDGNGPSNPEDCVVSVQDNRSLVNVSRGDKTAIELFRRGVMSASSQLSLAGQALTTMPS